MILETTGSHRSQHLSENDLEPPDPKCPFCGGTNRRYAYTLQEVPEVSLLLCDECHAVSASRMPKQDVLAKYYSDYYSLADIHAPDECVTFDDPSRMARHLADMYLRHRDDKNVSILDFGGGDGTISHETALELIKRGVAHANITVVDYAAKTVRPRNSHIEIEKVKSLNDIVEHYGLVIASAVIEHHPRPSALLQDLLARVANNGLFYARTPFVLPLMRFFGKVGAKWDFTYPGHLHDLGQTFWEGCFTKIPKETSADFQLLSSRPSIVQTSLNRHFMKTIVAYCIKSPW